MPWTFAHPAAVIPLRRLCPTPLNLAALTIGASTPDFGYYVGLFRLATHAHTLLGSILVCIPTGLLLLVCFYFVRRPVWNLLPQPHRGLLEPLVKKRAPVRFRELASATVSILIGAWTHVVWDSFTHRSGWVAVQYPVLREPVITLGSIELAPYYLLQHLSTLLGVVVLSVAYHAWIRRGGSEGFFLFRPEDRWRYASLVTLLVLSAAIAVPLAASAAQGSEGYAAVRVFVSKTAVFGAALFITLFVLSAIVAMIIKRSQPSSG
jgi:hypothetical protein